MSAKESLVAVLDESLKELGYRRRADSWRRLGSDLYSIVSLQQSGWDKSFYLNVGFAPAERVLRGWLAESKCLVRFRAEAINGISASGLRLLSDSAFAEMEEREWKAVVAKEIVGPIVDVLELATDLARLRQVLEDKVSKRVMVQAEMWATLESS